MGLLWNYSGARPSAFGDAPASFAYTTGAPVGPTGAAVGPLWGCSGVHGATLGHLGLLWAALPDANSWHSKQESAMDSWRSERLPDVDSWHSKQ